MNLEHYALSDEVDVFLYIYPHFSKMDILKMSFFENPALDLKFYTSSFLLRRNGAASNGADWDPFYLQKTLPIKSAPTSPRSAPMW